MRRAIVVGAGVLGCMHALEARRRGFQVVQLERELDARGASVRNFGLVWVSGRASGVELAFALRARELWGELGRELAGLGFRANGSLTIVERPDELAVLEQVLARDDAGARQLRLLEPAEVRALNPALQGSFLAGLYCASDAAVEPRRVPGALRSHLEAGGGYRFVPGCHVVELADGAVRDARGGRHEGDLVVVCPGAGDGLAGFEPARAPLARVRLQMLETEPFGLELTTSVADGDSLRYYPGFEVPARAALEPPSPLVAELRIQLLLQQRLDGALTIGDTHELEEPFEVALAEAPYRHLIERVESILGRPMPPVRRRWAGVYSQSANGALYHRERVGTRSWVVTGAGGRGMTFAPAIAEDVFAAIDAGG